MAIHPVKRGNAFFTNPTLTLTYALPWPYPLTSYIEEEDVAIPPVKRGNAFFTNPTLTLTCALP